jgi:transposase-like protein
MSHVCPCPRCRSPITVVIVPVNIEGRSEYKCQVCGELFCVQMSEKEIKDFQGNN